MTQLTKKSITSQDLSEERIMRSKISLTTCHTRTQTTTLETLLYQTHPILLVIAV